MKYIFLILIWLATFCVAQLPFRVKPRPRGFPGRRFRSGSLRTNIGRGAIEGMYRLNNSFIPIHYDIELRVILENEVDIGPGLTAPGKVKIVGVNQEKTSKIVLHANQLQINASSLKVTGTNHGALIPVKNVTDDLVRHFYIVELDTEINPQEQYEIYMEYIAKISESEEGLFYRFYETDTEELRKVAATQLESVEARRLFPCFDEPELKATFSLTVIRRNDYTTLSNTELISSTPDPEHEGWTVDKFAKTVRMSSYLLAFAITDYGYVEDFFGDKPIRVYAPNHLIDAGGGNYSVRIAALCLNFFETYLNESYKLSKMDAITIPEFGGAMENWGLNVFGNDYLLHFPEEESEAHRNLVTMVVAHELAHQWAGNLVTMKWWNELYLTEGLTEYMQYLGMDAVTPDLNGQEAFILDAFQYSMSFDATSLSHPLSRNVSTPDEIDDMFGTISYEKGASFFRMIEAFLTKETFRKGLQSYFKKYAFQSVTQDNLIECLQAVATQKNRLPKGLSLSNIMHSWTDQSGFPLVNVDVVNRSYVKLSQKPFKNRKVSSPEGTSSWYIPVTVYTESRPSKQNNIPEVWLETNGENKIIQCNSSQWIMINHNATGFYRVQYSQPLLQLIQQQLELGPNLISPLSRSQLLDDYFVFAKEGYVNIQSALNLTRYLYHETHFAPWGTFFQQFSVIYRRFTSHSAYPLLQKYFQPRIDNALNAIGLEEKSWHKGSNAMYRADLLDWSCSLQSPLCKEYAMKLFSQWRANMETNPITSIGTKETLHCAMVAHGGRSAYDFFFKKYHLAKKYPELREEIIGSLACAMEVDILQGLLQNAVNTSSGLQIMDASIVLEKVATNPVGRKIILDFLTSHIGYIVKHIGKGTAWPIITVLGKLTKYYCTKEQYDEVQNFTSLHAEQLSRYKSTVVSILSSLTNNVEWMDTVGIDIWTWMWNESKKINFKF